MSKRYETGESYGFFQYPEVTNINHYQEYQEKFLGYFNPPAAGENSYAQDYEVSCMNLAQVTTKENITLTVSPTSTLTVYFNNEEDIDRFLEVL